MVSDYNRGRMAEQYQEAKRRPFRGWVEDYTFLELTGDLTGKKVLDVACGEGHFTRILRKAGARHVVGLDISERMIELAREQEAREPLGIEYVVGDISSTVPQQDFDIVTAAWLLVYARSRAELAQMCRGLAPRVKPGGRFLTIINNPALYESPRLPDYRKYGVEFGLADHAYEGAPLIVKLLLSNSTLEIENYYLPIEAYTSSLATAGFTDVAVHSPRLAPDADTDGDTEYWDDFLEHPPMVFIDGTKG